MLSRAKSYLKRRWIQFYHRYGFINRKPLFILGNQKSGTTAIANLFSQSTNQSLFTDGFCLSDQQMVCDLLAGNISLANYVSRYRYFFAHKIIKEPDIAFLLPQLQSLFPHARYIFIIRRPEDNIRSILDRLKIPGNLENIQNADLTELNKAWGWEIVLDGQLFNTKGSNYIETLALRWNAFANIYLQNKSKFYLIRYEDFVVNKKAVIEKAAEYFHMDIHVDIQNLVNVQFQSKGANRNVPPLQFFGEKNLHMITSLCHDHYQQVYQNRNSESSPL